MSESERETNPQGEIATRTPPEGEPVVDPATAPDPYAHHAYGAQDDGEEPQPKRRRRRRERPAEPATEAAAAAAPPEPEPEPEPEPDDGYAPVIPLDRPSLLRDEPPRKLRIRKLRVLGVLIGLGFLAVISAIFGMTMAITSDLPQLEEPAGRNSVLVDRNGKSLGVLTGNQKRIFLQSNEIAPTMKQAIIAIEDRRFYTNAGIDLRGIGRALYQDILAKRAVQGGSTITMQFVKNALAAQDDRTLFNKLREAALAYQITRKWSKERILRNYLNTIYFGNGAYGIEAAARTYFGSDHPGCGEQGNRCASQLTPAEAALIAGIVASPSAYDPLAHREAAGRRRALVLQRMLEMGSITPQQQREALETSLPTSKDIQPPEEDTAYPYFTSWIKQQVVDKLGGGQEGARRAFEGGLTVQTTLDSRLQDAAQNAVDQMLPYQGGPRASLVAIKNSTGEVLAMVGGDDYSERPFNLATQGQRQPGSAFKPFVLAEALDSGISPDSTWASRKMSHCVTRKKGRCIESFEVNNYEDAYAGVRTLRTATTYSDNSVFAQVGIKVGTRKIAALARRMGIRTPVSHNFAMTLGGLSQGVTPLDMAHAYETFAQGGRFTYGTLSPGAVERSDLGTPTPGPVGIQRIGRQDDGKLEPITLPDGEKAVNKKVDWPVLKSSVADQVGSILSTVVSQGTGVRAQIPGVLVAGKTGTTENYGDAWFVGWTKEITVAVWVGYPDELRPMQTEYNGAPVAGGTFPAAIWKAFMDQARQYKEYGRDDKPEATATPTAPAPSTAAPEAATPAPATPTTPAPAEPAPAPEQQAPAPETQAPAAEQPPAEQPAPDTGSGGGTAPPPG
jgi:penicillin-binding protein 1A